MQKRIFSSLVLNGEPEADDWLRRRGIKFSVGDLYHDPRLCPECAPDLLELFKSDVPFSVRATVAEALFARRLNAAQKREAVEVLISFIKQNPERTSELSGLILNELADNLHADQAPEFGRMMLDERFGALRSSFAFSLRKVRSGEVVSLLKEAAKIPEVAPAALYSLAQMRAEGTLELCEEALKMPGILHKDAIKETYAKLKRKLAKQRTGVSHVTEEPAPGGFEEWSTNLDGSELSKVLRGISKCVEQGFGKAEISEVRTAADDLSPEGDTTVRLKFKVKIAGLETMLWVELFCDDDDAFDFHVFGEPEFIRKIDGKLSKLIRG